jgi:hypothetical protein
MILPPIYYFYHGEKTEEEHRTGARGHGRFYHKTHEQEGNERHEQEDKGEK